jgi:transglutaminase-like putative cysteine protease
MPALKQVSYRTTKERALAESTGTFDLGERTIVKVARALDEPHATRRVRYRATIKSGDIAGLFATGATQLVDKTVNPNSVDILVRSIRPVDALGTEFPADVPPSDDDSLPNSLIQSDDQQIQELASQIAPGAESKWDIAVALERHVRELIQNKGFTQALSSAAEVVRTREGDCTEHAVLLAALCRARGIPSRVAIGLIYYRPSAGFAYHMWTEVWIEDRWVPLDATLGQGGIGAAHLAVSRSNLNGVDPLTQFLPVLQLIGNLNLEIVSVE